jgi:hypothetical protein
MDPSPPPSAPPSPCTSSAPGTPSAHGPSRPGLAFWLGALVGGGIVAFAMSGLLENEPRGAASAARWLVGGAIVADLIVIPIAGALGLLTHRWVAPRAWPAVRFGLLTTAVLVGFALPLVLDQGGTPGNPTVRPRNYEVGLAVAIGATWAIVAAVLAIRWASERRRLAP